MSKRRKKSKKKKGKSKMKYKAAKVVECHEGAIPIFQLEGTCLYAGGWSRDAWPPSDWAVIDLTASYHDMGIAAKSGAPVWRNTLEVAEKVEQTHVAWLSLPIQDFGVPRADREFWDALALDIGWILRAGTPVLIACLGGHGRTGLVVSILASLMGAVPEGECPVEWLRELYCLHAVETNEQVEYVYEILGLGEPPKYLMPEPKTDWRYWFNRGEGGLEDEYHAQADDVPEWVEDEPVRASDGWYYRSTPDGTVECSEDGHFWEVLWSPDDEDDCPLDVSEIEELRNDVVTLYKEDGMAYRALEDGTIMSSSENGIWTVLIEPEEEEDDA